MTIARLLPHSGRALLLTKVLHCEDGFIRAVGRIGSSYPLAAAGEAPALVGIEMGAQAAAAMESRQRPQPGGAAPMPGRLVRIEEATFHRTHLPAERDLDVEATREVLRPPLAKYRVDVRLAGEHCLSASLSVYLIEVT